jgi:HK97 family phage prohead protease
VNGIERRYTSGVQVGIETRADGKPVIVGYASVFYDAADPGTEFRLWHDVVERIKPGAFDRAIRDDDVRALFNHDPNMILGRNGAGTLRLSVDSKGLRYEIDPPDTSAGRDVVEAIRRGDISGSSFGFTPDVSVFREEGETTIVERESVRLFDVSPVTFPAYEAATVGVRSAEDRDGVRRAVEAAKSAKRRARDPILARARVIELGIG